MEKKYKDWSCGMETEEYEQDMNLLIKDAIKAVEETGEEHSVNLVTPSVHGNPTKYLVPILEETFGLGISLSGVVIAVGSLLALLLSLLDKMEDGC